MPWRQNTEPYWILVSEVMLQQTQVERVVPKFEAFVQRFPGLKALAQATTAELLQAWQGLGYNRRAAYLQQAAQRVLSDFDGQLPHNPADLMKLPGIGPGTAGSIAAFAYNQPVIFIETNVRRTILHHFFADQVNVSDSDLVPILTQALGLIQSQDSNFEPRTWYWALMDYGTHLKTQTTNPNRRSKHYTKQAKFEGSNRQLRGEILRRLLEQPQSQDKIIKAIGSFSHDQVLAALSQLQKEGLVSYSKRRYSIAN